MNINNVAYVSSVRYIPFLVQPDILRISNSLTFFLAWTYDQQVIDTDFLCNFEMRCAHQEAMLADNKMSTLYNQIQR